MGASVLAALGVTAATGNPVAGLTGPFAVEMTQVIGPMAMAQAKKNGEDVPNKQDWIFATGGSITSGALNMLPFTKLKIPYTKLPCRSNRRRVYY